MAAKTSRKKTGLGVALSPCAKCPFRKDVPIYLRLERRQDIVETLADGNHFWCHESVGHEEDEDGEAWTDTSDSIECAGAAKAMMQSGGSSQMMRISERLGMAKLDKTAESKVEVWNLDDWNRLAEGSTGDKPVWEIGDEGGVNTCCYVGPNCIAPAGHMTPSGMALHGLEEATNECPGCGEYVCDECCNDEGYCGWCREDEEDEDE